MLVTGNLAAPCRESITPPIIFAMSEPVLEVANVRKHYGATVALGGVSLSIEAGELFGLIGPNGAGKTTLLKILCGLTEADSGEVKLFGQVFNRTRRDLRRLVGIGTQDLSIYPDLSARENLRFFGKLYGLGGQPLRSRVDEVLAAVGLTDRANDRAGTFSGGMKRRLNLAAAVVHGPRLLFLDEPTAGVDPQSRNHIFRQVKSLNEAGVTVIYTSHYMEEVAALCRRMAILDDGTFRACDTLPNLLRRLDGRVRFRLAAPVAGFENRLNSLPAAKKVKPTDTGFEVTSDSVSELLPAVMTLASELGATITAIEPHEPTLERVFLHLTGRELRD
jgi:ABC-2 type transport system ATP-binding protein